MAQVCLKKFWMSIRRTTVNSYDEKTKQIHNYGGLTKRRRNRREGLRLFVLTHMRDSATLAWYCVVARRAAIVVLRMYAQQ